MSKLDQLRAEFGANVDESTAGPDPSTRRIVAHPAAPSRSPRMVGVERSRDTALIDLDRIVPDPDQPRKEFTGAELQDLAESLRERGQLQPIRVRWVEGEGRYMLIMGERRFRAARVAGLKSLEAVIHDRPLTAAEVLKIQVIENTVRADLKPVEKAHAIRRLMDEFGQTQAQVAGELKMSQQAVADALALLRLDAEVQAKVDEGVISKRVAQQIARVDSPEAQREVAAEVERGGLTEAETAEVVRSKRGGPKAAGKGRTAIKARPRRPTVRTIKTTAARVTVEFKRAVDPAEVIAALKEATAKLEAEQGDDRRENDAA